MGSLYDPETQVGYTGGINRVYPFQFNRATYIVNQPDSPFQQERGNVEIDFANQPRLEDAGGADDDILVP